MTSKIIIIGLHHIKGIFWIFNKIISVLTLLMRYVANNLKQFGFFYLRYNDDRQNKILAHGLFPVKAKELAYRVLGIISQLTGEMS